MNTTTNWWDLDRAAQRHLGEAFAEEDIPLVLKSLKDRTCVSTGRVQGTVKFDEVKFLDKLRLKGVIPYYIYASLTRCAGPGEYVAWTKDAKASLSALLNLSDGIMGATLNLRVIATTNQELGDIDRAILRPGRLLERVHVGLLTAPQASEVFSRLSGGKAKKYRALTALAQVYEDVRKVQA